MRGTYRGAERAQVRELWRRDQTPHFMRHETEPLRPFLEGKRRMTAIDVGANKGFWTKALIASYGDRVEHSYMIDASPENYRELTNRDDSLLLEDYDFAKSTAFHFAVGEKIGSITLHTNEDGSPLSSVFKTEFDYGFDPQKVEIVVPLDTIDNFVEKQNIKHVDVLKIDTEGYEFPVLLGATGCFERAMIDVVLFEFGLHQIASRHFFLDFFKLFSSFDMKLYAIDRNGAVSAISRYHPSLERFVECENFLAVREPSGNQ
jgi:FkbM family methyltransferase